ncbi:MAG: DUF503 domain-containing protein [Gemmatimonadales bacterium]|nr:MAG: DUF503 domain-containing protein [Gemmatimonadales bacterium]
MSTRPHVVVLTFQLSIPGCRSLKEKRGVLRSVVDRLRSRYPVSVAETGSQDVHDRGEVTVAFVTSDARRGDSIASRVDTFLEETPRVLILGTRREDH